MLFPTESCPQKRLCSEGLLISVNLFVSSKQHCSVLFRVSTIAGNYYHYYWCSFYVSSKHLYLRCCMHFVFIENNSNWDVVFIHFHQSTSSWDVVFNSISSKHLQSRCCVNFNSSKHLRLRCHIHFGLSSTSSWDVYSFQFDFVSYSKHCLYVQASTSFLIFHNIIVDAFYYFIISSSSSGVKMWGTV